MKSDSMNIARRKTRRGWKKGASRWITRIVLAAALFLTWGVWVASLNAGPAERQKLAAAIQETDVEKQEKAVQELIGTEDAWIEQVLTAWRGGTVYLLEQNGATIPVLLDSQVDADGAAKGMKVTDGEAVTDEKGAALMLQANELTAADANARLRRAIKAALDLFSLGNPNPKMRRDAVVKVGQEQKVESVGALRSRLGVEKDREVRRALEEAIALIEAATADGEARVKAVERLWELRSINSISYLTSVEAEMAKAPAKYDAAHMKAVADTLRGLREYVLWGNRLGTAFRGLSLAAVLLVAALGLAITFGLMGVINMAHGELIMVGAYSAYVTQRLFQGWFGASGAGFESYFIVALGVSFAASGFVGWVLERGVIRYLYKRPLESLLATWGVSLVLQQLFRHVFGAANVQVTSPQWLSGSFVLWDVLFAYNRIFVIGFAVFIVLGTYALLTRTSWGLLIRAVMQNRTMAAALGVRASRVNMVTFAFGSGLAGMAGACLSQIGNVGPSLGQTYIVDCFMVVVLGGVGNLVGTVSAALGVGVTDQLLQPWLGAVLGKITVLAGIILFLQWKPAGLFVTRSRSLEG